MIGNGQLTRALIVIGGHAPMSQALAYLDPDTVIICADSGLDHALALGLTPNVFLGDMDSVSVASLERSRHEDWEIITHDSDKDQTDTELALAYAVAHNFQHVTLLWGSGDRIDHILGVMAALADPSLSVMKTLLAWIGSDRVEILHGPKKLDSTAPIGSTLSLIPLGGSAHGVTTAGLMWNLDNEELSAHSARSVSNRVKKTSIQISIDRGVLAIVYPGFLTTPREHESSQQ